MSVLIRRIVAEGEKWDHKIWISYDPDEKVISFCEACSTADSETLTNTGLKITAEDWHVMLATLDREGNAIYNNVVMFTLPDNKIGIAWVTQNDDLHLGKSYAPGRIHRLITDRNLINLD